MTNVIKEARQTSAAAGSEHKKVSIVLATYNGERYLRQQLDSLLGQQNVETEIIACDDHSSDGTLAILREYLMRAPARLTVIEQPQNVGFVRNFETGIKAATGYYIALSDQDDVWLPNKLARLRDALDHGAALSFCNLEIVDENLRPLGYDMWTTLDFDRRERSLVQHGRVLEVLLKRNVVNGCSLMMRRDVACKALPLPELRSFVHDQWLALFAAFLGPVIACPGKLVLYRQHHAQQTGGEKDDVSDRLFRTCAVHDMGEAMSDWDMLFDRLSRAGADPDTVRWARSWVQRKEVARRERAALSGPGTIVRLLASSDYRRYFSGFRSCTKDVYQLIVPARFRQSPRKP